MRMHSTFLTAICLSLFALPLAAQDTGQKSLAGTLGIYVFPSKGQDAKQQSEDESACYQWAVSNSGIDPFEVQKQQTAEAQQAQAAQQQAAKAGAGSGARGAVGGAAAGALIGEIADDDAGKGAAWGAGVGLLAGHRRGRRANYEAQQQAEAQTEQSQQASEEQLGDFKKAFSACLEGKNYIAKY